MTALNSTSVVDSSHHHSRRTVRVAQFAGRALLITIASLLTAFVSSVVIGAYLPSTPKIGILGPVIAGQWPLHLSVIVGGSGRFFGPVVGTIVIILLPEVLRSSSIESLKFMQKWYLVFFGLAVVALMIWLPGGILSIADRFRKQGARR